MHIVDTKFREHKTRVKQLAGSREILLNLKNADLHIVFAFDAEDFWLCSRSFKTNTPPKYSGEMGFCSCFIHMYKLKVFVESNEDKERKPANRQFCKQILYCYHYHPT